MASTYLSRTPASAGNRKIWTFSAWVKLASSLTSDRVIFGAGDDGDNQTFLNFQDTQGILFSYELANVRYLINTSAVFRDVSAWYHIVLSVDTTQATDTNRVKLYVNGIQQTFNTVLNGFPPQNADTFVNKTSAHAIGYASWTSSSYFDGSMAHVHLIDGTAYDASAFGETDATTGIWKPKTAPSVTYGTNGFFLKFENSGSMGTDSSGNANNFTVNGTPTQTVDTPSNVFATWNVLEWTRGSEASFSNGNLSVQQTLGIDDHRRFLSTLGMSQGKWYWEVKSTSSATNISNGITDGTGNYANYIGQLTNDVAYYGNGSIYKNDTTLLSVSSISNGDIVNIALDLDNNYIYFGLNGTYFNSGDPISGSSGTGGFSVNSGVTYFPSMSMYINNQSSSANFGNGYFGTTAVSSAQSPSDGVGIFEYAVPTGYKALCTKSINAQEYS